MMGQQFGRYESIRAIASGGMASVHLARAVGEGGFERLVAIKVMHPHIAEDPDFRAMFLDEARLAARIRHPNVVGVLDVETSEDSMFLVMEYVDGPSLHQLRREFHKSGTTLPIGVTLRIFIDVLTGLHDAHELNGSDGQPLRLIHRDISPQNILVGKDGAARITDFGVARAEARISSTRGGQLKGKIAYMCPEQIRNEHLDRRADVYGVGAAMWEALTGRRLFRADTDAGLIQMIFDGPRGAPHEVNEEVAKPISDLCMRALSRDRHQRPPTAADFADQLEEAAALAFVDVASQRNVASFIRSLPEGLTTPKASQQSLPSAPTLDEMPIPAVLTEQIITGPTSGVSSLSAPKAMVTSQQPPPSTASPRWVVIVAAAALVVGGVVAASALSGSDPADDEPEVAPARHAEPPSREPIVEAAHPSLSSGATGETSAQGESPEQLDIPEPASSGDADTPRPEPPSSPTGERTSPTKKKPKPSPKRPKFLPKDL